MSRHVRLPLDPDAVAAADKALYDNHPEMQGQPLSATDPQQADLRKEWMDSYTSPADNSGGGDPMSDDPPGAPVLPCHKAGAGKATGKPCDNQGLSDQKNVDEYASEMKKLKHDWPRMNKNQRMTALQVAANRQLHKGGTPDIVVQTNPKTPQGNAEYDFQTGTVSVSDADLTAAHMPASMAGTVYHESRHAEQWSNIARKDAGDAKARAKGRTPPPTDHQIANDIHNSTFIAMPITEAAARNPITPASPQFKCAEVMTNAVYGSGSKHRDKTLKDLKRKGAVVDSLNHDAEKMNHAAEIAHSTTATEAEKTKARADYHKAETHYQKTLSTHGYKSADAAYADNDKTYKAYKALPEEADAWATEAKVQAAMH